MGNRAVITFDKNPTANSVGVYLHWNGGAESVLAFLEACNHFAVRDDSDPAYQLGRFLQIVGNYFGGTISLGVGTLDRLDCQNYDNGVYRVTRSGKTITMEQSPRGSLSGPWVPLDLACVKAHAYWTPNEKGVPQILADVIERNNEPFTRKD